MLSPGSLRQKKSPPPPKIGGAMALPTATVVCPEKPQRQTPKRHKAERKRDMRQAYGA